MGKKFFKLGVIALTMSSAALNVNAQVGINNESPKATLDVVASKTNGTTAEGVIAPRLTGDQMALADAKYGTEQNGTLVYATQKVGTPTAKTKNVTKPGYYYYDAPNSIWVAVGAGDGWYYMPSFNLPLGATVGAALTFNLYNEYVRQFTRLGNTQYKSSEATDTTATDEALYKPADLKFVVTAYSGDVITVTKIDSDGWLYYTVNSATVPDGSFINVIFKVK